MAILRLQAAAREIGAEVILDSISAAIARDDRIGLVGANGAGKTTLLRLCAGLDEPDKGQVTRARGLRLGLLTQESNLDTAFTAAPSVREAVRAGATELVAMEARLRELEDAGEAGVSSAEYGRLHDEFDARAGYSLDIRVDATLSGLGFARDDWSRPPTELSGGQQTRAALARLLVSELDLLMLDEPTNHLDLAAIEWLENQLASRQGGLLVASHDRAFLDAVVLRVWELRDRRLEAFRGNYGAYLAQREERDARARKAAETRSEGIDREQELVQRYRSHRKFSKMHEHERRLAALQDQVVATPERSRSARLALTGADGNGRVARSGDVALDLEDVVVGFPGVAVARTGRLEARRGERIGVVGPNGAGKTTLLRTIAGELAPMDGFLRLGSASRSATWPRCAAHPPPVPPSSTPSPARRAWTAARRAATSRASCSAATTCSNRWRNSPAVNGLGSSWRSWESRPPTCSFSTSRRTTLTSRPVRRWKHSFVNRPPPCSSCPTTADCWKGFAHSCGWLIARPMAGRS